MGPTRQERDPCRGVAPGIAFGVFTALFVSAVAVVARRHELAASAVNAALDGYAVLLATAVALRADPATTAVNFLVTGGLLAMLVHAHGNDRWLRYGLRDWLLAALRLAGHEITGGGELVMRTAAGAPRRAAATPTARCRCSGGWPGRPAGPPRPWLHGGRRRPGQPQRALRRVRARADPLLLRRPCGDDGRRHELRRVRAPRVR